MEIAYYLKKGYNNAQCDKILFLRWEDGEIDLPQTMRLFKRNNDINSSVNISETEFENWLNSLGYLRCTK